MKKQEKSKYIGLGKPDLAELLGELIDDKDYRLIFVEYDPLTCSFYNHIGLPKKAKSSIIEIIFKKNASIKYKDFISILLKRFLEVINGNKVENIRSNTINGYKKRIEQDLSNLLNYQKKINTQDDLIKFLENILPNHNEDDNLNKSLYKSNEGNKDIFISNLKKTMELIPVLPDTGGCGEKRLHKEIWEKVNNSSDEIEKFITAAAFETIFGIRSHYENNIWNCIEHMRLNLYLETGEYAGQVIAFKLENETDDKSKRVKLTFIAIEALDTIRKILPNIRQARYIDSILQGGKGNVEHILLRYLPVLIPAKELYIRFDLKMNTCEEKEVKVLWENFFKNSEQNKFDIYFHGKYNKNNSYSHFKTPKETLNSKELPDYVKEVKKNLKNIFDNNESLKSLEFFYSREYMYFGFSKGSSEENISRVSLIAVLDNKYFEINSQDENNSLKDKDYQEKLIAFLKNKDSSYSIDNIEYKLYGELLNKINGKPNKQKNYEFHKKKRARYIHTALSILLNPGHIILSQIKRARKEGGKTYSQRYGTVVFESSYLNIDQQKSDIQSNSRPFQNSQDYEKVLESIRNTYSNLTDTIRAPHGYRGISRIICDSFFEKAWYYLVSTNSNPSTLKFNENNQLNNDFTPLGNLLWNALDFEDTLNMDAGYREHFVHSFHVFLLGIHLMKKMPALNRLIENNENTKNILKKWFLTSMYHDIGYPIEKIDKISKGYIQKLLKGSEDNSNIECKLNPDWSSIIRNEDFINVFNDLCDKFIECFIDVDDSSLRKDLIRNIGINKNNINNYKEISKRTFRKLSFNALTKNADHGIFSALLFLTAAKKDKKLWEKNKIIFEEVAIAIFAHNTLDRSQKQGEKWHLPNKFIKYDKNQKRVMTGEKFFNKKITYEAGFAFPLLLYDILSSNSGRLKNNWLTCLLIICDACAQWGREDNNEDKGFMCLKPHNIECKKISGEPLKETKVGPMVSLCYPKLEDEELLKIMKRFYHPQLHVILIEPEINDFLKLSIGRCNISDQNSLSKCSKCQHGGLTSSNISISKRPVDIESIYDFELED